MSEEKVVRSRVDIKEKCVVTVSSLIGSNELMFKWLMDNGVPTVEVTLGNKYATEAGKFTFDEVLTATDLMLKKLAKKRC